MIQTKKCLVGYPNQAHDVLGYLKEQSGYGAKRSDVVRTEPLPMKPRASHCVFGLWSRKNLRLDFNRMNARGEVIGQEVKRTGIPGAQEE